MSAQIVLANSDLFTRALNDFTLAKAERQEIVHARTKAIAMSFSKLVPSHSAFIVLRRTTADFTPSDVFTCSEKFWDAGLHPINLIDVAASALASIHVNLTVGTLSEYITRPEVAELCRKLLAFEVSCVSTHTPHSKISDFCIIRGHYMLTEVAHGLDSQNIETTATLLEDGGFDFHTPNPGAAKYVLLVFLWRYYNLMTTIYQQIYAGYHSSWRRAENGDNPGQTHRSRLGSRHPPLCR